MDRDPATIRHLLSVDPGTVVSAWALWARAGEAWGLERWNEVKRPTPTILRAVLDRLGGLPGVAPETSHMVVEGQWLGSRRQGGSPHKHVLALSDQRAHWEAVAELAGWSREVQDSAWVLRVTRGAPMATDMPQKHTRDSERRLAWVGRHRWPELEAQRRRPSKDAWAAILLGQFWLEQHGQRIARPGTRKKR